ncbi:GntR family transcriptional regulator [bacterium]|nr:GntR family transcriptional regulator [bacterium]
MTIHVSTRSGVPIYLQIMQQIEQMIATGRLEAGQELLPIRSLAQQLLINPNTVARAYRDLELKGALVTKQGAGTYVADSRPRLSEEDRRKLLGERLDEMVVLAHQLAIEASEVLEMFEERLQPLIPSESEMPRSPFDDEFID